MRAGAGLDQRLADEQPACAGLHRDVDLLAPEPSRPLADGLRRGADAAPVDLARPPIHSVEGDLRSMHVEPGYDRHWGLL